MVPRLQFLAAFSFLIYAYFLCGSHFIIRIEIPSQAVDSQIYISSLHCSNELSLIVFLATWHFCLSVTWEFQLQNVQSWGPTISHHLFTNCCPLVFPTSINGTAVLPVVQAKDLGVLSLTSRSNPSASPTSFSKNYPEPNHCSATIVSPSLVYATVISCWD